MREENIQDTGLQMVGAQTRSLPHHHSLQCGAYYYNTFGDDCRRISGARIAQVTQWVCGQPGLP